MKYTRGIGKRYMAVLVVLAMIVGVFPTVVNGASLYVFDSSTGTITDYNSSGGEVVIPAEIGGVAVEHIGADAFRSNNLTSVTIPDSVTSIGDYAFCSNNLTLVTIPDSVTTIGYFAFGYNKLTSVTISDGVTSIGANAFDHNELTSVTIPASVISIGDNAFQCNKLTSVTISDGVTSIGKYAFYTNQLTSVTIPDSITCISQGAFSDNQLTEITIPDSVTSIEAYAFKINQLTEITIPGSVTSIAEYAFSDNQLTEITIPNSVTSIGHYAFYKDKLTSVTIPASVTSIGQKAFGENQITTITMEGSDIVMNWGIFNEGLLSYFNSAYTTGGAGTYIGTQTGPWEKVISDAEKLAEAKAVIETALVNLAVSNSATADTILTIAQAATLYGVAVDWDSTNGFLKTDATSTAAGSITGALNLTLGEASESIAVNKTIAKILFIDSIDDITMNSLDGSLPSVTVRDENGEIVTGKTKLYTCEVLSGYGARISSSDRYISLGEGTPNGTYTVTVSLSDRSAEPITFDLQLNIRVPASIVLSPLYVELVKDGAEGEFIVYFPMATVYDNDNNQIEDARCRIVADDFEALNEYITGIEGEEIGFRLSHEAPTGTYRLTYGLSSGDFPELTSDFEIIIRNPRIVYTADAGGSISGEAIQSVAPNASGTQVIAVPDSGYAFSRWSDGVMTASRTEENVTGDINVTAQFTEAEDNVIAKVATPIANPGGGEFTGSPNVTITSVTGASIYYTLDGSEPTNSSERYTEPIVISETTTLKAIACITGLTTSDTFTTIYTKRTIPVTTTPSLTAGTVNRTSDTTGTVSFNSPEPGEYYYAIVEDGGAEPAMITSVSGSAIAVAGEISITNPVGLTAGAKDIYIKMKNREGKVSDALKIDIAAYVAPDNDIPTYPTYPINPGISDVLNESNTHKDRQITVNGVNGANSETVGMVAIVRDVINNRKIDKVILEQEKTEKIIEKLKEQNKDKVQIVIDDLAEDTADEASVIIKNEALKKMTDGRIALEIKTEEVSIQVPRETLQTISGSEEDLYFRMVPIKEEEAQEDVLLDAMSAMLVLEAAGSSEIQTLGIPMTIETNYKELATKLTFSLKNITIPTEEGLREKFLSSLAVYINHSDGEKELSYGTIVYDSEGNPVGLEIEVSKFSTFTLLKISNTAPAISNLIIKGIAKVGQEVRAAYSYMDADQDEQGASLIQWFRADNKNGTDKTVIDEASKSTYEITKKDSDSYLVCEVTPIAKTGVTTGAAISTYIHIEAYNEAPKVASLLVKGTMTAGSKLTASYTYQDEENNKEGKSLYQWYRSEDTKGKNKKAIKGANQNTYTLTNEDIGKYITVAVTPVAVKGSKKGSKVLYTTKTTVKDVVVLYNCHMKLGVIGSETYAVEIAAIIKKNYDSTNVVVKKEGKYYRVYADFVNKTAAKETGNDLITKKYIRNYDLFR